MPLARTVRGQVTATRCVIGADCAGRDYARCYWCVAPFRWWRGGKVPATSPPRWLPSPERSAVLPGLRSLSDATMAPRKMAPRNSGSGERPPTRRPQKKPGGRALQKHGPVTPMQRRESERRSVATWTHQQGTEAPRYFYSDAPWKAQRRVRRDLPVDRVPWPFRGCTVTEVDAAAQGAQLPASPEAVLCAECRGTVFHSSHYEGRRHAQRAGPAADGGGRAGEVTTLGDAELAAFCLRRLRENPRFAALLTASAEPSPAPTVTEAGARDTTDAVRADHVLDWTLDL
ncbi:hypothetical protein HPB50_002950 [Hyalomma asiaticum]|uniref:Uncharacterized protein n=1 Tax=Hyalomma asiaticum TaxID=266040 RepID=A0ACB7SM15_HYAAI|nr:hypothetical protein HPB50_002950 [Hyalomma asiaticum]